NTSPIAAPSPLRRRSARSNCARSDRTIFARRPEQLAGDSRKTRPSRACRFVERRVLIPLSSYTRAGTMPRWTAWLVMVVCAATGLLALAVFTPPQPTLYLTLAEHLADRGAYALDGEPTNYIEPFYPFLLAGARLVSGGAEWRMLALQVAVASAAGVALFAIAHARTGSNRVAWIATALYACSPYLVRQAASFMEVTVATALAIAAVWSTDRARTAGGAAVAGLVFAALVLTRFSFLPIAAGGI